MRAVIVEASPNREGNSMTLAKQLITGLNRDNDHQISELYLKDLNIEHCTGCWSCIKRGEPGCVIADDMTWIYPKLNESDLIVFATPIYWWHINAQLKKFIDRLEGLLDGAGPNNLSGRTLVLLLSYTAEDPDGVYLVIQMFRSIAAWGGMNLEVLRYNSTDGHVSENKEKLEEAYQLGTKLSRFKRLELSVSCPVKDCKGVFSSTDSLARHLASGADRNHIVWREENGFKSLGMKTDELWMSISKMLGA